MLQRPESAPQLKDEIEVHRKLSSCGNALKLYQVFESEAWVILVLEFQEGGSLLDLMRKETKLKEADLQAIMG